LIEPFPQDWELVEVLGHPQLTDPGLPWAYNHLTFGIVNGEDELTLSIERGYGQFTLEWSRAAAVIVTLSWDDVASLSIRKERGTEAIVVERRAERGRLTLQLKPNIQLFIG
jgi:hypothetical protein